MQRRELVVVWRTVSQGSHLQIGLLLKGLSLSYFFFASYLHGRVSSCPYPLIPFVCYISSFSPAVGCLSHSLPSRPCPSYSLPLSHHSQYRIHNEGVCYVRKLLSPIAHCSIK